VLLGYRNGKPLRPSFYGEAKDDVRRLIATAVRQFEAGNVTSFNKKKLGEYLDDWLEQVVRQSVRVRTHQSYRDLVGRHIKPALGSTDLRALTPYQVQTFLKAKQDSGFTTYGTLARRSCSRKAFPREW
jgi:hypothetical protein